MKVEPGVYRRGGKYYVYVKVAGKTKYASFDTLMAARKGKFALQEQQKVRKTLTLAGYIDQHFRRAAEVRAPMSVKDVAYRLNVILNAPIAQRELSSIDEDDLREFILTFKATPGSRTGKLPDDGYVYNIVGLLKRIFHHARMKGFIQLDPAFDIPNPKARVKPRQFVQAKTFVDMLDIFQIGNGGSKEWVALAIVLHAGLRVGETFGLKWEDVDFDKSVIYVRRQLHPERRMSEVLKTTGAYRIAPMDHDLAYILRVWRLKTTGDYVFTSPQGHNQPYYPKYIREVVNQYLKKKFNCTLRDFRSYAASFSKEAGLMIDDRAAQLGHSEAVHRKHYDREDVVKRMQRVAEVQNRFLEQLRKEEKQG